MSTDPVPGPSSEPTPSDPRAWFARLGLSGQLLFFGGIAGVIAAFLPLISLGPLGSFGMVVQMWQGTICLLGYLATIAFAFLLYQPGGVKAEMKPLVWVAVGVAGLVALLSLWLLLVVLRVIQIAGIGAFVNFLAAGAVAAGAVLKARDEKLF
jgi:hypothetical protein